jgi:hypothetical protein
MYQVSAAADNHLRNGNVAAADKIDDSPGHLADSGAGEGNRTLVISLEGFSSTIELHPPLETRAIPWPPPPDTPI